MLRTYKICNPIKEFSKYEFNSMLLDGVNATLLRVTLHVTWTQPYIYKEKRRWCPHSATIAYKPQLLLYSIQLCEFHALIKVNF